LSGAPVALLNILRIFVVVFDIFHAYTIASLLGVTRSGAATVSATVSRTTSGITTTAISRLTATVVAGLGATTRTTLTLLGSSLPLPGSLVVYVRT